MSIWDSLPQYTELFISRKDDHAMQLANGRYRRVGAPLSRLDLADHLLGVRSYGTYVIDETGSCRFAVFDADSDDGLSVLWGVQQHLLRCGTVSYLETSRRGGHLWLFFERPYPASWVRAWLLPSCPASVELYPKQDASRHYGSLIRLPLGIHRLSGKRYPWLVSWSSNQKSVQAGATVEETLVWLSQAEKVRVPAPPSTPETATPHTHIDNPMPPLSHSLYPNIHAWCCQIDPITLIGRYVKVSPSGLGCCPFGDHHRMGQDRQASFKVYPPSRPGGCCWHCYAWSKGGNVFNFLCYWYRLDARTLWHRIQAGETF